MRRAIFIGYRRDDTGDVAGRIYDALTRAFGANQVFKDVDSIPMGAQYAAHIGTLLPKCRVFLALIGPGWLDARDARGARRLVDPSDLVRIEIETALRTPRLVVVPVLVNGAHMPEEEALPEALRPLVRRHAAILKRDPDFHTDTSRLVGALREHVRTGRLNLQALGGAARAAANAAGVSGWVVAAWLAGGGLVVTSAVPEIREPVLSAGADLVESVRNSVTRANGAEGDGPVAGEVLRQPPAPLQDVYVRPGAFRTGNLLAQVDAASLASSEAGCCLGDGKSYYDVRATATLRITNMGTTPVFVALQRRPGISLALDNGVTLFPQDWAEDVGTTSCIPAHTGWGETCDDEALYNEIAPGASIVAIIAFRDDRLSQGHAASLPSVQTGSLSGALSVFAEGASVDTRSSAQIGVANFPVRNSAAVVVQQGQ